MYKGPKYEFAMLTWERKGRDMMMLLLLGRRMEA